MKAMNKQDTVIINQVLRANALFKWQVDSVFYQRYVLSLLFLRYLSDNHHNKYDPEQKIIIDFETSFDYLLSVVAKDNLGLAINQLITRIETNNPDKFTGFFDGLDFTNVAIFTINEVNILPQIVMILGEDKFTLKANNVEGGLASIANDFNRLLNLLSEESTKRRGELNLPDSLTTILTELVAPTTGDSIYDPTCGFGSLLLQFAEKALECRLYGQEINADNFALAKINMYLHQVAANIYCGDTLRNPQHINAGKLLQFDKVVAYPPFCLYDWGYTDLLDDKYDRFAKYGLPPRNKVDYAFVLHMLASLKDNGTMAVILPQGVLFRSAAEAKIRQKLLVDNLLDCVINLPVGLFSTTAIATCILLFKKSRSNQDVLIIDASKDFDKQRRNNILNTLQVAKILDVYKNRVSIDGYSKLASLDEIAKNEFNLSANLYCSSVDEQIADKLKNITDKLSQLESQLMDVKFSMRKSVRELGLTDMPNKIRPYMSL